MILLIDNYDSFVQNLGRYFQRLGQTIRVVRNDAVTIEQIREMQPQAIVISPGPCGPDTAGISLEVVKQLGSEIPVLGVCLGHQVIGQAYGARITRAAEPVHGRSSAIEHGGHEVFSTLPSPFEACRYHSLVVAEDSLPDCLEKTAWLEDGTIMGVAHVEHPVVGIQFHPESVLTSAGFRLLANYLEWVGIQVSVEIPSAQAEYASDPGTPFELPDRPVTF